MICKYKGKGGDLIVGRVESVRTNGEVLLTNLVSDTRSVKKASVLSARNMIVSKADAMAVLGSDFFPANVQSRELIRARAVAFATRGKGAAAPPAQLKLNLMGIKKNMVTLAKAIKAAEDPALLQAQERMWHVVAGYRALNNEMRKEALRGILDTVLMQLP